MQTTTAALSFVSPTSVQLRFELGAVVEAVQTTDLPTGARIDEEDNWVWKDGGWIGRVGGREDQIFMPIDTFLPSEIGDLFDWTDVNGTLRAPVDTLGDWSVLVNGQEVAATGISRKSNIIDTAETGWFTFDFRTLENVFLELDTPLREGDRIEVRFDDPDFPILTARFTPATTISEAIHVNLRGFDPDDGHKVAYLSSWNGWEVDAATPDGGAGVPVRYAPGTGFEVVDEATGAVVSSGVFEMAKALEETTDFSRNYQLTDVLSAEFSEVTTPGTYHVRVEGVGRSQSFEIRDDHWSSLFDVAFSGFYHQRSGIALEQPYTDWERPRSLHPEDGVVVKQSTVKLMDVQEGFDNAAPDPFSLFPGSETGEILTDAWGGWHDAGDWDRRTQHIEASRKLLELVEIAPDFAKARAASIPEAGNGIPDLIDEAMWNLDLFRRLQKDDGGVPGGIESGSHPRYGEGSWNESLEVYAYAPDIWSSWEYAAGAAKLAHALETYDPAAAPIWRESALAAMEWAEARLPTGELNAILQTSRNVAAAELFRLTGDGRWHDVYKESSVYTRDLNDVQWFEHQFEAAFVYARTDAPDIDAALRDTGIADIERETTFFELDNTGSPFGFAMNPYAPYGWGNTGQQPNFSADHYARLHHLTGEQVWLDKMMADVQYTLGANPMNTAFMTGLGVREPLKILNADAEALGTTPPPGITLYGDYNIFDYGKGFYHDIMYDDVWPNYWQTPVAESFNAFSVFVPSTEYTVQQGISDMTFVTGYLASVQEDVAQAAPFMEVGTLTAAQAGDRWTTVTFAERIEDAVVVMGPLSRNGGDPAHTRVRNVTEEGFEFQIEEWEYLDGAHAAETVSWIAASAGTYTLGDATLQFGATDTGAPRKTSVDLAEAFEKAPMVFSQVASATNPAAVASRLTEVSADGFDFILEHEEARRAEPFGAETVHWLAVEGGATGPITNGTVSARQDYRTLPGATGEEALFAAMQSYEGTNTAGLRYKETDDGRLHILVEEEQSLDAETLHLWEEVGWMQLETGTYDLTSIDLLL